MAKAPTTRNDADIRSMHAAFALVLTLLVALPRLGCSQPPEQLAEQLSEYATEGVRTRLVVTNPRPSVSRPLVDSRRPPAPVAEVGSFDQWMAGFQQRARMAGISEQTLSAALNGLAPNPKVLALDHRQSEYNQTFFTYLRNNISAQRIQRGRALLAQHADLLMRLENRYGVPKETLVALWAMESDFGRNTGDFSVIRSLATLAHAGRRRDFFEAELMAALRIIDQGLATPAQLRGSWAGAMGQPQFMPTTYLDYATDADGDGRADIWGSTADTLGSAANYLWSIGWQPDRTWGREVRLPNDFDYYDARLSNVLPLERWAAMGVTRANGEPLPRAPVQGAVLLPAGKDGPAFLIYDNFHAITDWNRSLHYALTVCHLSDRVAGAGPLIGQPPPGDQALARADVLAMQQGLNALGYDAGTPDGMVGFQTRHAVRDFQQRAGLPADAYPTPALIARIDAAARPAVEPRVPGPSGGSAP